MTDIVPLGFWLILLPWIFILSYTTIYFFINNFFFFECLCFSEYAIRMFLFVFWSKNRPSIKYLRIWGNGGESHSKCVQVRRGGEGYHVSCVRMHLRDLFSCFYFMVSCFICRNLTLPLFKKGVFVRNGSISVVVK